MSELRAGSRIGVDVGGTFTDVVCVRDGRPPLVFKVPSTPANPGEAALAAVERLAAEGVEPGSLTQLAHGTTVATNAVLERKGGRLGIIATEGFRDTLEIGRQMRREMYEVRLDPQTPVFLAPRAMRIGVRERIGPAGEVIEPLDEGSVRDALDRLVAAGAECIAVCLLFSFVNPEHERRVREIARSDHPELEISLSSEVDPAFREYERTAVTAFDAYIKPTVGRYLADLARRMEDAGVPAPLQIMQSRGGLASADIARGRPVRLFLSGPAAGVIGGQATGAAAGHDDLITLDVGGTSSDIALVSGAKPLIRSEGVIDEFPVRVPMVDVNAIGAGGGSVAWLDDAGGLRVGPRSAGSEPGPACYARGGGEPTVTDASVVLGYLDPKYFAGGAIELDVERARDAIAKRIAAPLGLGIEDAAAGIHQVVNAQMAEGIRLVSVRQGFDPREFTLVAMGGAGPLHACALAADLAIARVVVPRHPGVLSAAGLLAAPIEHEVSTAYAEPLPDSRWRRCGASSPSSTRQAGSSWSAKGSPRTTTSTCSTSPTSAMSARATTWKCRSIRAPMTVSSASTRTSSRPTSGSTATRSRRPPASSTSGPCIASGCPAPRMRRRRGSRVPHPGRAGALPRREPAPARRPAVPAWALDDPPGLPPMARPMAPASPASRPEERTPAARVPAIGAWSGFRTSRPRSRPASSPGTRSPPATGSRVPRSSSRTTPPPSFPPAGPRSPETTGS